MDKKILALIAIGVGLFLFAVSMYLVAQSDTKIPEKTYANFTTPESVYQNPAPATVKKEMPKLLPTPEQTPKTIVQPISENKWVVTLTTDKWFDTGIPVIANETVNISQSGSSSNPDENTLVKLGEQIYFNKDGRQLYTFEDKGVSPRYRETIKLKLDGRVSQTVLQIVIENLHGKCLDREGHKPIHDASGAWAGKIKQNMLKKL